MARLTLLGAGAFIAADGINQWLLGQWQSSLPAVETAVTRAPETARPGMQSRRDYGAVVRRNLFNSNPSPMVTAPTAISSGPIIPPTPVAVPLNLNVRLTGTVVADEAAQSYAFIYDVSARKEKLLHVGEEVTEGAIVASIQRDEVRLTRGKSEQILRLFEKKKPGAVGTPTAVVTPASPSDGGNFTIDRAEMDEALSNLPRLLTQARLLPNFRAGVTDGFRIFNIVPGSLFAKIGLRNGDILHRINSVEVKDPAKFMGMFNELKTESYITLDLVRGGARKTFEYEIR